VYDDVEYINTHTKVKIRCKLHGYFEQSPSKHLSGHGCTICNSGWTRERIVEFVNSIQNKDLLEMDSIELQLIINQGKLPDALESLVFNSSGTRENSIKALKESLYENVLDNNIEDNESSEQEEIADTTNPEIDNIQISELASNNNHSDIQEKYLPITLTNNINDLHVIDNTIVASCDEETIDFLIQYKLRKLWNNVLNENVNIEKLRTETGGKNFNILKELFFKEYDEVIAFKPPAGYCFKFPLLPMQQLTAYRVLKNKRYGNWSGTGAGKTISFIVTSRAVQSRVTILIGLNSTINQRFCQ
jgi:hypothetical protein